MAQITSLWYYHAYGILHLRQVFDTVKAYARAAPFRTFQMDLFSQQCDFLKIVVHDTWLSLEFKVSNRRYTSICRIKQFLAMLQGILRCTMARAYSTVVVLVQITHFWGNVWICKALKRATLAETFLCLKNVTKIKYHVCVIHA